MTFINGTGDVSLYMQIPNEKMTLNDMTVMSFKEGKK